MIHLAFKSDLYFYDFYVYLANTDKGYFFPLFFGCLSRLLLVPKHQRMSYLSNHAFNYISSSD